MAYLEHVHAHPSFDDIRAELRRTLSFVEDDLKYNRRGLLGPGQRAALLRRALVPPALALLAGVALSLWVRLIWAGVAEQSLGHFAIALIRDLATFDAPGLLRDYFLLADASTPRIARAIFILPLGLCLLHIRKPSTDALLDTMSGVAVLRGEAYAQCHERPIGRFRSQESVREDFFVIDSQRLAIPPAARSVLVPSVEYCIYYSRHSRNVLSAEPVEHSPKVRAQSA